MKEYYHAKKTGAKKRKKPLGLDKTIKAANAAGVSYGMYQAMLREQEAENG